MSFSVCVCPVMRLVTCPGCTPPLAQWMLAETPASRDPYQDKCIEDGCMDHLNHTHRVSRWMCVGVCGYTYVEARGGRRVTSVILGKTVFAIYSLYLVCFCAVC